MGAPVFSYFFMMSKALLMSRPGLVIYLPDTRIFGS